MCLFTCQSYLLFVVVVVVVVVIVVVMVFVLSLSGFTVYLCLMPFQPTFDICSSLFKVLARPARHCSWEQPKESQLVPTITATPSSPPFHKAKYK